MQDTEMGLVVSSSILHREQKGNAPSPTDIHRKHLSCKAHHVKASTLGRKKTITAIEIRDLWETARTNFPNINFVENLPQFFFFFFLNGNYHNLRQNPTAQILLSGDYMQIKTLLRIDHKDTTNNNSDNNHFNTNHHATAPPNAL